MRLKCFKKGLAIYGRHLEAMNEGSVFTFPLIYLSQSLDETVYKQKRFGLYVCVAIQLQVSAS